MNNTAFNSYYRANTPLATLSDSAGDAAALQRLLVKLRLME